MEFEWDPDEEAANVEPRWVAIGTHPATQKSVAVVYAIREGRYRIISARRARAHEEEEYQRQVAREAQQTESAKEAGSDDQR
jgi:uncharacterized DUF497 family protein